MESSAKGLKPGSIVAQGQFPKVGLGVGSLTAINVVFMGVGYTVQEEGRVPLH